MLDRLKVLVVEDEEEIRDFVGFCLEDFLGNRVEYFSSSDGLDALEKTKTCKYDLIITDINMPNMDGKEFIQRVLSDQTINRETPVIVLSSYPDIGFDQDNLIYIMKKPFKIERLTNIVRIALGKKLVKEAS
ncbi:response regulator [Halobacteriovorax sp. HLS]|uniref:response regulator n=1 Tax=Halobacteriovorax sp. HLS TaxID=2234000 RepID=UPI0013E389E9|nr:response regulator [Halobacteriovorax sp. HLS]